MAKGNKAQLLAETAANIAAVASKAFAAAESKAAVVAAIFKACGAKPNLETFNACQLSFMAGAMASALARKGDNRTEAVLIAHCKSRLTGYATFGGSRLKDGQKGFRTEEEELAKGSAAVLWGRIYSEAGVTRPSGKSGPTVGTSNNAAGANGKNKGKVGGAVSGAQAEPARKVSDKAPIPKFATEKQAVAWGKREAAHILAVINANAGKVPNWMKSAVSDFKTAIDNAKASDVPVKAEKPKLEVVA